MRLSKRSGGEVIAVMGGPPIPARPSLDRLKSFDTLPDLASQLQEANQLSTHNTRADMIARWLLERLKSDVEARTNPDTWRTLSSALRLLSRQRTAFLLASQDFLGTVKATLEHTHVLNVLLAVMDVVNLLLETSLDIHGAPVKAALSVPAIEAASFLGAWLRCVYDVAVLGSNPISQAVQYSHLHPSIRIWKLRKHSAEENGLFADACLAPAASLLSVLTPKSAHQAPKRKRQDHEKSSEQDCKQALESLVARHIFLPARTAFFRAQDLAESKGRRPIGSQHPTFTITAMLEPLEAAFALDDEQARDQLASLPLLLNIALRSTPTPTPRQRLKEKPWVEAVFEALHQCNKSAAGGVTSCTALVQMLRVIGERASLSREALESIVRQYSNLGRTSEGDVDWELIAQVIDLDADVLVDNEAVEILFSEVTSAMVKPHAVSSNPDLPADISVDSYPLDDMTQTLLREGIVIPIMKAFAQRRNLVAFVDLWSKQLQPDYHTQIWSVRTELDDSFGALLEDSITESRISDMFDHYAGVILATPNLETMDGVETSQPKLDASIIILNAILAGVQSESLMDELHERLGRLFDMTLQLYDSFAEKMKSGKSEDVIDWRGWSLMTRAFELWFPTWVSQESTAGAIAGKVLSLVKSAAVKSALSFAKEVRRNKGSPARAFRTACEAECFVTCVCSHFYKYQPGVREDIWDHYGIVMDELIQQMHASSPQALLVYPDSISIMDDTVRNDLFFDWIDTAATGSASALQALHSTAAAAVARGHLEVINDLVRVCVTHCEGDKDEGEVESPSTQEVVVINLLSTIPVTALTRAQRESILDAVSSLPPITNPSQEKYFQRCLALMVHLMEVPNATCVLSTDLGALWRLALSASTAMYPPSEGSTHGNTDPDRSTERSALASTDTYETPDNYVHNSNIMHTSRTLELLGELASLNLRYLLATQDQERSLSMLFGFSAEIEKHMDLFDDHSQLSGCGNILTLVTSGIREFEAGSREDLKTKLCHRNPQKLKRFTEALFKRLAARMSTIIDAESALVSTDWLPVVLDTLLNMPESLIPIDAFEMDMKTTPLLGAMCSILDENKTGYMQGRNGLDGINNSFRRFEQGSEALKAILLQCYKLCCKFVKVQSDLGLAKLSTRLLQLRLPSRDHASLIQYFEHWVDRLDRESRMSLLEELLTQDKAVQASSLLLVQVCIAKSHNDNLNNAKDSLHTKLLPQLLAVANEATSLPIRRRSIACITTVLKEKSFMVNQRSIEGTLASLPRLLQNRHAAPIVYADVCRIMSILLLQYRSRLHGRFHVVVKVFQRLMSRLFKTTKPISRNDAPTRELGVKHASALARLLTLFCEPPQRRQQSQPSSLVDESRKEQAHVGRYVQYLLQHYCCQLLNGTLGDGMSNALTPGLWSMIEAMEINDADSIKSLNAAMNNSERAVLRSVYDKWRRFGKWRGG